MNATDPSNQDLTPYPHSSEQKPMSFLRPTFVDPSGSVFLPGTSLWACGYAVSPVGFELDQVHQYLRAQEESDETKAQL